MVAPNDDGSAQRRRIEIVHESLLTKWPRLVRWQAQDEEGAVLRDQLRQAASVWDQHSRSEGMKTRSSISSSRVRADSWCRSMKHRFVRGLWRLGVPETERS